MMSSLPEGWSQKESKSHEGRVYYINNYTGETTWHLPTKPAHKSDGEEVHVYHILRKHRESRRPSSWRQQEITQSKQDAIAQIDAIIKQLHATGGGFDELFQRFMDIARTESDCGSHEKGGDLGLFGRGAMQKPFEEAAFKLRVGEMSGIVETDSGVHVLLRVR